MSTININGDNNIVTNAGGDINQNVATNVTGAITGLSSLIDVSEGLKKFGLSDVYHWLFTVKMNGKNISAPQLHKQYVRFNDNAWTKGILNFINIATTKATLSEVKYEYQYNEPNYHIEAALSLSKNNIQFEYAQYKPKDLMTNFGGELLPSLLLLYFCETLYSDSSNVDIEILIETTVHGKLYFQANGINFFNISRSMNTYAMSENKHTINERITNFDNTTVIDVLEKIVEGYASVSRTNPFLGIDASAQQKTLNNIRDTVFKQFRN